MSIKTKLHYNAQLDCVDGWESTEKDGPKQLATQALVFMIRGITQNWKQVPYIPENKPRIFGGFYKAKVGGSAYFRVYAPQKKITS